MLGRPGHSTFSRYGWTFDGDVQGQGWMPFLWLEVGVDFQLLRYPTRSITNRGFVETSSEVTFRDLEPERDYELYVRRGNTAGLGRAFILRVRTPEARPRGNPLLRGQDLALRQMLRFVGEEATYQGQQIRVVPLNTRTSRSAAQVINGELTGRVQGIRRGIALLVRYLDVEGNLAFPRGVHSFETDGNMVPLGHRLDPVDRIGWRGTVWVVDQLRWDGSLTAVFVVSPLEGEARGSSNVPDWWPSDRRNVVNDGGI